MSARSARGASLAWGRSRWAWVVVLIVLLLGLGARSFWPPRSGQRPPVLTILIWPEYLSPAVIARFEKQEKCVIRLETYSNNEELRDMLVENRFPGADIVVPSSYALESLRSKGFLKVLDRGKIPQRKYVDAPFLTESGLDRWADVAVPYFVAPTGLAFAPGANLGEKILGTNEAGIATMSWSVFERPPAAGDAWASRFTLLNDKREAIAAGLICAGLSPAATDLVSLRRAEEILTAWGDAGMRFDGRAYPYHLLSGRNRVAHAFMGDVIPLGGGVRFALPREGYVVTCDCLAILAGSTQGELAHRFIDFLCDPEVSAENMQWCLYRAPNQAAFERIQGRLEHPVLGFLGAPWGKPGTILGPLSPEDEKRFDELWERLRKYREE